MRRMSTFAALLLLPGGAFAGLTSLVAVNAPAITRAVSASLAAASFRFVDTCVSLFSLGPLQPVLILTWLLLLGLLLWLSGRLAWELNSRHLRTRRSVATIQRSRAVAMPPDLSRQCRKLNLMGLVDLVDLPEPLAFCHGLRSPRIILSTGLCRQLREVETEAVLVHERMHLLRRDPLRLLLAQSVAAAFGPLSMVRSLAGRLTVEQEVIADRAVVRSQGGTAHLAAALLRLVGGADWEQYPAELAISGISPTALRVEALADPIAAQKLLSAPADSRRMGIAILAVSVVAGLAFTQAVQAGHVVHHCPAVSQMLLHYLA